MNSRKYLLDIEELLGSVAKIKFLRVLYRYQNIAHPISFLAKEAKISVNQAKLIVDSYGDLGFLDCRYAGKSLLTRMKKGSIHYEMVDKIFSLYENITDILINDLKAQLKNNKMSCQAWIYGSLARNDLSRDSDIDILLLFETAGLLEANKNKVSLIQDKLAEKYQKNFSFLLLTKNRYIKEYKSLKKNIEMEGEKIYG